jgi:hypothetical protein
LAGSKPGEADAVLVAGDTGGTGGVPGVDGCRVVASHGGSVTGGCAVGTGAVGADGTEAGAVGGVEAAVVVGAGAAEAARAGNDAITVVEMQTPATNARIRMRDRPRSRDTKVTGVAPLLKG